MDKPGRAREFTRCSVFFFSCDRVYVCIFSLFIAFFLVEPCLFSLSFSSFFPLDSFIILLCGKPNLSEGRSIILRRNSVAGYVRGGEERRGEERVGGGGKDCV